MMNRTTKSQKTQIGLYIHIPFCVRKCGYCDFLSCTAEESLTRKYVTALSKEIMSFKESASDYLVKTIYIGGGTPSCLPEQDIVKIMEIVKEVFTIDMIHDKVEITIEANPGTLSEEKLAAYQRAGVNRLSVGLQSADNKELELLGRIHTYEQFEENYYLARKMGFHNINVDLISGLPGQTMLDFEKTLKKVTALEPEHISAYSLIVEEGTPFYHNYGPSSAGAKELPSEETDRSIYEKTKEILKQHGYYRYEISNYAKKGFESEHNSSYWKRTEYLGIGLGASSLIQNVRYHNEDSLAEYIRLSDDYRKLKREVTLLSREAQMEEFMFLGLRMCSGIEKKVFRQQFQEEIERVYGKILKQLKEEELVIEDKNRVYLTGRGLDLSNYVMAQFLFD